MFDFDLNQGTLFEKDGFKFAVIKSYSWIAGQQETGQRRIEIKMCMPANASKANEWVKFEPEFFCYVKELKGEHE